MLIVNEAEEVLVCALNKMEELPPHAEIIESSEVGASGITVLMVSITTLIAAL